ncbi:MAG TPA: Gfo/Idh/MocA family oxidoreductase [Oscillospiraceae bacterium]|nr:Gfo/Idh/MocA family oxidoreductase [Oscillospiraceae bacterium]
MKKIGLIGCGFMGGMHSACYHAIKEAKLVAVADVRPEKAKEIAQKYGAEAYSTGMELINNADMDVIDICLPTYLHCEHAVAAMKKGRDVFVEKPICMNPEEGKLLLKTEKETGAKVQVGLVIRSWNEYMWLKDTAVSGKYGRITSAYFGRLSPKPTWAWNNWLHNPECSGTMALDLHIHDIDYMRYLLGEPKNISSQAGRNDKGIIEHIYSVFSYENAAVSVEGGWGFSQEFPFSMSFRVQFEKAAVVLDANGLTVYCNNGEVLKPEIKEEFRLNSEIGGNVSSLGGYYNELSYFIDCLEQGKEITRAPLCEAVKSMELVLKEIETAGGMVKK